MTTEKKLKFNERGYLFAGIALGAIMSFFGGVSANYVSKLDPLIGPVIYILFFIFLGIIIIGMFKNRI